MFEKFHFFNGPHPEFAPLKQRISLSLIGNWPDLFPTLMLRCGKVSQKDFVELTAALLFRLLAKFINAAIIGLSEFLCISNLPIALYFLDTHLPQPILQLFHGKSSDCKLFFGFTMYRYFGGK